VCACFFPPHLSFFLCLSVSLTLRRSLAQIYVSEHSAGSRIRVFELDGKCVASFGQEGPKHQRLCFPTGICLSPDGSEVYVCDKDKVRIVVFSSAGGFLRSWGTEGRGNGELGSLDAIAVSADGSEVFVSEGCSYGYVKPNHRVSVFSRAGDFRRTIGSEGRDCGQFAGPAGLTLTSLRTLLVCDRMNMRVQELAATDGTPVHVIPSDEARLSSPCGVCLGNDDELFVCQEEDILVFKRGM
jgi:DNA-binding beta-propeller fold protein YncE